MVGDRCLSCNVLVISEDSSKDQHILRPLVSRLLRECGKTNANVTVWPNLKVRGFQHVRDHLPIIIDRYRHLDVLLFLPDADGNQAGRRVLFANLEGEHGRKLICCAAIEEVEVWLLASHTDMLSQPWPAIRADISVKENVFAPFLRDHGDSRRPGGGREELMQQTVTNMPGLLARCPELSDLQQRICEALA
jgi:hypothetical protein